MRPDLWQSCTEIFNAAVERPPNARAALLEQRCNGDEALRRKVELLLKYHDESGDFIDSPAFVVAPELLVDDPNALVGQHLGCYRIDGILGAGGMGVVYLACDERLGRKVGLKLLPPSLLAEEARWERLKHEARAASALNHPNIMTIHEVGEVDSTHYIATEFIEGATLRERMTTGPIPPNEAVDIAIQVASALCVAHRAGIAHRDIKPENIMLRPDGYVKVLDFGIAKFTQQETLATKRPAGVHLTTQEGKILGTARYMSPEQARGQTVDARSDLWSLGVVLYEMLAGCPPFDGETPTDVIAAVLLKHPEPVEQRASIVPPGLQSVVEKSLRKDPADRYQTAEQMLSELRAIEERTDGIAPAAATDSIRGSNRPARNTRWIGVAAAVVALLVCVAVFYGWRNRQADRPAPPAPIEKGIAVLPFENLSAEKADAFFADGIQDDVLTSVGKIKDLKVIARASVMDYRGARLAGKVRQIGQTLGVSHVLEGSVRRVTDRVVVNVALIDTRDERQVWSERYERTLIDTISLQGELAIEIARALHATLTPAEATLAAARPTDNAETYLLYLRAREMEIEGDSAEEDEAAIKLYQQAIDLDPNFALARARLSMCASQRAFWGEPSAWKAKARAEAEEAVRLRPGLGEAHLALTHYYLFGEDNPDRALRELDRAAELLPNSAEVPLTAAFIYKRQNRYRDRMAALHRAEALDPLNRQVLAKIINTLRWVRDWREAMHAFDRRVAVTPEGRSCTSRWSRAYDEFQLSGDINALKKTTAEQPDADTAANRDSLNAARYETAMLERDYPEAARLLATIPSELLGEVQEPASPHLKAFHEALLAVATNAKAKKEALELARSAVEKRLAFDGSDRPDEDLALLDAFLGRKDEAIRQAYHAIDRAIGPAGTIEKNRASAALAMVYAQVGEPEKALDLIEHLLTVPGELQGGAVYNMTLTDLKWRWQWDPLRSHPRFQKLLAGPEPKTVY